MILVFDSIFGKNLMNTMPKLTWNYLERAQIKEMNKLWKAFITLLTVKLNKIKFLNYSLVAFSVFSSSL